VGSVPSVPEFRPRISDAEIDRIKPHILVCLGATAAKALLGNQFSVTRQRKELIPSPLAPKVLATVHPSSLLRIEDEKERHKEMDRFVNDMRKVAGLLDSSNAKGSSLTVAA
jgi:uracil-DNA glycosylase